MAVAFASYNTQTKDSGGGTSITVTKPTGLAAGDLMIAIFSCSQNRTAVLSGWTLLFDHNGGNPPYNDVLVKVASSADAAATNFTFTGFADGDSLIGAICRITGASFGGADNFSYDTDHIEGDDTPVYSGGVTTISSNDLLLFGVGVLDNQAISTYAVTTNNPTWTEQFEVLANLTQDLGLGVATAPYTTPGATGDYSASIAGALGATTSAFLIKISESESVTVSPAVITMTASVQTPTVTGDANVTTTVITMTASVQAPTVTTEASKWVNKAKSSAITPVNKTKS